MSNRVEFDTGGVLTVEEAAHFLRISRTLLYRLMRAGKLPYVLLGRSRRIPKEGILELLAGKSKDTPSTGIEFPR